MGRTDEQAVASHHALLALHRAAGGTAPLTPGMSALGMGAALEAVAAATGDEVTVSARLDVLGALAAADFPGYDEHETAYLALAATVGGDRVSADQVLTDMKTAAQDPGLFGSTSTAAALPHETTAFFMADACRVHGVVVDGRPATWIFSEFETDAPFESVAEWVNPVNWPQRSPQMFKLMDSVGGAPTAVPAPPGVVQWHGIFHEQVQLVDRLDTLLHCDYYEDAGRFAAMSYDLTFSVANQLDVDRGFLLAVELGRSRHVKALKIVGFTEPEWNEVATWVCPVWTDFVRGAVRGGTTSIPRPPSDRPTPDTPGNSGGGAPMGDGVDPAAAVQEWIGFLGETMGEYADLAIDWASAMTGGEYGPQHLVRDGARLWSQLARDWSRAWVKTMSMMDALAESGVDVSALVPATSGGPGPAPTRVPHIEDLVDAAASQIEGTTLPMPGLDLRAPVAVGDLVRIGGSRPVISGSNVSVRMTPLTEDTPGVHLEVDASAVAPGVYVSEALVGAPGEQVKRPVQLYVSRARLRGTP